MGSSLLPISGSLRITTSFILSSDFSGSPFHFGSAPFRLSTPLRLFSLFIGSSPLAATPLAYVSASVVPSSNLSASSVHSDSTLYQITASQIQTAELRRSSYWLFSQLFLASMPFSQPTLFSKNERNAMSSQDFDSNADAGSAPIGAIVGGVVGGLLIVAMIIIGMLWFRRRHASETSEVEETANDSTDLTTVYTEDDKLISEYGISNDDLGDELPDAE
jgi:hypothetical protein